MTMRLFLLALTAMACKDVGVPTETNDEEVITTVELTLDGTTYVWSNPDQGTPEIDEVTLAVGTASYTVRFLNELSNPAEDITEEILAEADEHQVFMESDALVAEPSDTDSAGLPLGLAGMLTADTAGDTTLTVTLRHLPEEGGVAVKVAGLEDTVEAEGIEAIPGETDVSVTFDVTVQ